LTRKVKQALHENLSHMAADALNRVARAADEIARLEPRLERARADLHAAIREAVNEGVAVAVVARVAGLSRQRVSQLTQADRG
jgi:hypothetical protein